MLRKDTVFLRSIPTTRRSWLATGLIGCLGCANPSVNNSDAGKGPPLPEDRFGNDPQLVADFAALKTCVYRDGRLDRSCPKLLALEGRIRRKSRTADRRVKVVTTLANLLESRRELSRLVAAESLLPFDREPKIVSAVWAALGRERVPRIKATLLSRACWRANPRVRVKAVELLSATQDLLVQRQAIACLGRTTPGATRGSSRDPDRNPDRNADADGQTDGQTGRQAAKPSKGSAPSRHSVVTLLVEILKENRSSEVRGDACVTLGRMKAYRATPRIAELLADDSVAWRCCTALASLGTEAAYQPLLRHIRQSIARHQMSRKDASLKVPAQFIRTLMTFANKPFFDAESVRHVLSQVASAKAALSPVTRRFAVQALEELQP